MFKIDKNNFKGKEIRVLISNFFSLLILQGLNVLLPFFTIPFIYNLLGVEYLGILTIGNTIAILFSVFVDFGFNNSATREISLKSEDKKELERIFSEVLTTKFFLTIISLIVYAILIFSVPNYNKHWDLFLLYSGIIIGLALFPLWFFQGMQQMKYITYINVFFKSLFTICIFIFVHSLKEIWLIPVFVSLGYLLSGIASLLLVRYKFQISFYIASFNEVKNQLNSSYHLFLSELYITLLANTNVIVLDFFAGSSAVGIYSIAEKVIRAAGNLLNPFVNVLYPHIAKKMEENIKEGVTLVNKVIKWGTIFILSVSILVFIFADLLFFIIFKDKDDGSLKNIVLVFRILSIFPLLSFLDQVYGKLILITTGKERLFSKVFSICAVLNLFLCFVLSYLYQYLGAAIGSTIIQLLLAYGMYYYAKPVINNNR